MPVLDVYFPNNKPEVQLLVQWSKSKLRGEEGDRKEGRGEFLSSHIAHVHCIWGETFGFKWQKARSSQPGIEKKLLAAVVKP